MTPEIFLEKLASIIPKSKEKVMLDSLEVSKRKLSDGIPPPIRDITTLLKKRKQFQKPYEFFRNMLKYEGQKLGILYLKSPVKERMQGMETRITQKQQRFLASKGVFLKKNQKVEIPDRYTGYEKLLQDSVEIASKRIPEKIGRIIEKEFRE